MLQTISLYFYPVFQIMIQVKAQVLLTINHVAWCVFNFDIFCVVSRTVASVLIGLNVSGGLNSVDVQKNVLGERYQTATVSTA